MSAPASMISCLNARSGSLPANSPSAGTCRPASRRSGRSRARRSRSGRRPCVVRKYLLRHGSGMYWTSSPRRGVGWTSESTHRTAMRSAAGYPLWLAVTVIVVSSLIAYCATVRTAMAGLSMPYSCAALRQHSLSRCSALYAPGTVNSLQLPVRIARAEHHHVVLAGEAGPFAGEVDVAGAVEAALHEEHVAGQVVAGHLRRPRRLLEVRPAEAVHPPDERRQHVGGAVGPDELQRRASFRRPPRRSCSSGDTGSSAP